MATCSQAEDYVAGKLSASDSRAFETHAASCPSCGKALVRRKAVERAASVMRRNQGARDTRDVPSAPTQQIEAAPASASAATREWTREPDLAPNPKGKRIAIAAGVVLTVGVAIALWSSSGTSQSQSEAPPIAAAPKPADAAAQPEPQPTVIAPAPAEAPPPEPPHPVAEAPAKAPAPTPAPTPTKTDGKQQDWLPVGTDIEELASTVAGKRCGSAVTALRDRVTRNKADARSWALLTTCYAKRKRWQPALDAYDMVVQYGDQALVASVQSHADAARAGQKAEAEAAAAVPAVAPPE
jgi:type IV secretory pathway VirB10-like protein